METFSHYRLKQTEEGYELILFLNEGMTEFSDELDAAQKGDSKSLVEEARSYTLKYLPNLKVKAIKVVAGTLLVTSLGFTNLTPSAEAANDNIEPSTTTYTVVAGDTLSEIAERYGTTVDAIQTKNFLNTDLIRIGQNLTIPLSTTTPTENTYVVVSGDTLSEIAVKYGTTVNAIKQVNHLTSDLIRVGQTLTIPTTSVQHTERMYQVVAGDTLSHIAARYGTTVDAIKTANHLSSDFLSIGQVLTIPFATTIPTNEAATNVNAEELEWLAKIVSAEARGESLEGQIAVAAVILNRVSSDQFPNTIYDVIYEKSYGHYQFSPAGNGELDRATPNSANYEAARRALNGEDPTNGSLFFYNPDKSSDQWVRSRTVSTIIGNHVFAH